jgi:selenocysteine-specific elongation factor
VSHLILGTAGHVDHGKTALIKALTGFDCDTHKEEKTRGITINLGFTHLDLSSGDSIGIVDVPGHKDFVHTMVGGATGIDLCVLVVAADSGIMPQTVEHLQIMDVLGIRNGLVALTKCDLVDDDIAAMAEEEIKELLAGTFLENCPILKVSATTGQGVDELKAQIEDIASRVSGRAQGQVFRMFVDRVFSVSGFGTVVTGSVMSGALKVEDTAYLLPGGDEELRVRRLERHGKEVEQVVAGERASINLVGMDREDFQRGMIIGDRVLPGTRMVDAMLRVFQHTHDLKLWSQVIFHLGTFEDTARIHLIDSDSISAGEAALVQVHLSRPCVIQHGDRFVVRSSSNDVTLGGGEIIDAAPLHHRRRPEKLIRELRTVAEGELAALIASEVRKRYSAVSHDEIADRLNISAEEVLEIVAGGLPDDIVCHKSDDKAFLIVRGEHDRLMAQALKKIAAFHRRHPFLEEGRTIDELTGLIGIARGTSSEALFRLMLVEGVEQGKLKRVRHTWALAEHSAEIGSEMAIRIEFVEGFLQGCRMQTPLMSDLNMKARSRKINAQELNEILRYLVSSRKAFFVEGEYLHSSVVDRCREMLLSELERRGMGMTVAEFRDLVNGNRKICLLLLAIYDGEGVTERQGDVRVITDKGRGRHRLA